MLATHHFKFADSTLQIKAIQKRLDADVPSHLICSRNVIQRQELWACPNNASDIRIWREESAKALPLVQSGMYEFKTQLPTEFDGHMKSVLLPMTEDVEQYQDKSDIPYVASSPVSSLGLIHEVFKRPLETGQSTHLVDHLLQSNPMSLSNHGETLLMQSGHYRAFKAHIPSKKYLNEQDFDYISEQLDDSHIMFKARVEKINSNSGLIAEGLPSITAIGGFVHMLERETLQNISFAVGVKSVATQDGKQRYVDQSVKNKAKLKKGISANVRATMGEITATVELVLLLKINGQVDAEKLKTLIDLLKHQNFRIASGTVWDREVLHKRLNEYDFIGVLWVYSPKHFQTKINQYFDQHPMVTVHQKSKDREPQVFDRESDLLDCAIALHHTYENGNSYSILSNGYLLLESPQERRGMRTNGFDHAISEPSFCIVNISNETNFSTMFWQRHVDEKFVYWW